VIKVASILVQYVTRRIMLRGNDLAVQIGEMFQSDRNIPAEYRALHPARGYFCGGGTYSLGTAEPSPKKY
jgi:hypothetical protein